MRAPAPLLVLLAMAALVLAQQTFTVGGDGLLWRTINNWLHVPMFALLALLLVWLLERPSWLTLLAGCVGLAAFTEGLQIFSARSASLLDVGRDLLGAAPVIAAVELSRRTARRVRRRWIWGLTVLVLVVTTAAAPLRVLLAYRERDQLFPQLVDPGNRFMTPLISTNSDVRVVRAPPDWPGRAGEAVWSVTWGKTRYPGIHLTEVVPAWQGFSTLAVDVYLPHGPPVTLTAAVGHAGMPGTAAHLRLEVRPGHQQLRYDLATLLGTSSGAAPRITRLVLHTSDRHAGRTLLIGPVRLEEHPVADAGNLWCRGSRRPAAAMTTKVLEECADHEET